MANTYVLISSNTVGSGGAASVTFSSIASTYTDLLILASPRSARNATEDELFIRFNSDSGNNYYYQAVMGDGSSITSTSGSAVDAVKRGHTNGNLTTALSFGSHSLYVAGYAGTVYQKTVSSDDMQENYAAGPDTRQCMRIGRWANTAAITSITLLPEVSTFLQYSSFYLYGINNS